MEKFLETIKEVLTKANEEYGAEIDVMGYVETLRQNKDKDQIKSMVNNFKDFDYGDISYSIDETGGYTNGELILLGNETYIITLLYESELKGYCRCKPTDKDYNEKHECCGNHCDWDFPVIKIKELEGTEKYKFKGTQRDLWNIQDGIIEEKQDKKILVSELRKLQLDTLQYIEMAVNNIYKIEEQLNKLESIA